MGTELRHATSNPSAQADVAAPTEAALPVRTADPARRAVIYRAARSTMQAGLARTKGWILRFVPAVPSPVDPLMGWTGSRDTRRQIELNFPTREAAEAYAQEKGLDYELREPHLPTMKRRSYAENFRKDRLEPWSH